MMMSKGRVLRMLGIGGAIAVVVVLVMVVFAVVNIGGEVVDQGKLLEEIQRTQATLEGQIAKARKCEGACKDEEITLREVDPFNEYGPEIARLRGWTQDAEQTFKGMVETMEALNFELELLRGEVGAMQRSPETSRADVDFGDMLKSLQGEVRTISEKVDAAIAEFELFTGMYKSDKIEWEQRIGALEAKLETPETWLK